MYNDKEAKIKTRIKYAAKNKINYLQYTMCPSLQDDSDIETIESALNYYKYQGIKQVIVQPKYMGSYCDIYLHRDHKQSYFVSRSGYVIKHVDVNVMQIASEWIHKRLFDKYSEAQLFIVQSELMPWAALGEGLIDNHFSPYLFLHGKKADMLETIKSAARYVLQEHHNVYDDLQIGKMETVDLLKKYPHHILKQVRSAWKLLQGHNYDIDAYKKGLSIYEKQLELYGREMAIHFKPFNWMKYVNSDGREVYNKSNLTGFQDVSDDAFLLCEVNELELAQHFFTALSDDGMEGVVIKPTSLRSSITAPALKVRNNEYLHLIYGWDFGLNKDKYRSKRNIAKKLQTSISEWRTSREIFKIPYSKINEDNELYKRLFMNWIKDEDSEATIDNRL